MGPARRTGLAPPPPTAVLGPPGRSHKRSCGADRRACGAERAPPPSACGCRDLKPENFLLESKKDDALIKCTDFGLSVFFKPGQKFKEVVGSGEGRGRAARGPGKGGPGHTAGAACFPGTPGGAEP